MIDTMEATAEHARAYLLIFLAGISVLPFSIVLFSQTRNFGMEF